MTSSKTKPAIAISLRLLALGLRAAATGAAAAAALSLSTRSDNSRAADAALAPLDGVGSSGLAADCAQAAESLGRADHGWIGRLHPAMAGVTNTGESNPTSGSWSQQADRIRAAPKAALSDRAQGRITGATSTTIALNASQITSDTLTVAQGGTALTEKDASGGPPKRGREWQLRAKPLLRVLPMPLPTTTLIAIVVCLLSFVPGVRASASTSDGTLLSDYKYAWSSNGGQVAFALASGVAHAKTLLKQTTVLVGESGIPSADIGL